MAAACAEKKRKVAWNIHSVSEIRICQHEMTIILESWDALFRELFCVVSQVSQYSVVRSVEQSCNPEMHLILQCSIREEIMLAVCRIFLNKTLLRGRSLHSGIREIPICVFYIDQSNSAAHNGIVNEGLLLLSDAFLPVSHQSLATFAIYNPEGIPQAYKNRLRHGGDV